jgi:maleate isomerase
MEPDLYGMAPQGVTMHSARMFLRDVTRDSLEKMADDAIRSATLLKSAHVDLLLFGCTSGSLIKGVEWERNIVQKLTRSTGIPTITTAGAVIEALRYMKATRVSVFTPYTAEINHLEKRFLKEHGFIVDKILGLGYTDNLAIGTVTPETILNHIKPDESSDTVFISCTNLPVLTLIENLEALHQKPVITSNQASMWLALRYLNQPFRKGYGKLLRSPNVGVV